jgi:serine/threonine protein kinase
MLAAPELLAVARQVARGLAAAHATVLIHRDIRSANILVESGPELRVKISDFGLARATDDAALRHNYATTPRPYAESRCFLAGLVWACRVRRTR